MRLHISRGTILCLLLCLCVSFGCENNQPPQTSNTTPSPHIGEPRIAVLSPSLARYIEAMGLQSTIVARHGFDTWTDPSLPIAGDQEGIDYAALLSADPTIVLTEWGSARPLPTRLVQLADKHDWTVLNIETRSIEHTAQAADTLDTVFGALVPADKRAAWQATRSQLKSLTAPRPIEGIESLGSALVLYAASPPAVLGTESVHHALMTHIGLPDAAPDLGPYATLALEDIAAFNPGTIIMFETKPQGADRLTGDQLKAQLGPIAALEIDAVIHERVIVIHHPHAFLSGPATARLDHLLRNAIRSILPASAE